MTARSFRDLIVWQKAHAFTLDAYRLTGRFPSAERYGLTSQLRRAAVSIAANIDEGFRKRSKTDKARFYDISQGSIEECRYYLILAQDLGYASTAQLEAQLDEIGRLLDAYMRTMLIDGP